VSFNHSTAANTGRSAIISVPNIEAALNFADPTTLRIGESGYFARIYVAQTAIRTAGAGDSDFNVVETSGIYYPLGDLDFDGTVATYTWDGEIIPDRLSQLKRNARYFGWVPSPHQDQRYELDLRVLRMPPEFQDDQDTLPLHEAFHPAFLHLFLSYLCFMDGVDLKASAFHRSLFESLAEIPRDVDESPAAVVEPVPWDGDDRSNRYGRFTDE